MTTLPGPVGASRQSKPRKRPRETIDELARGALRVRVYAGVDPVSGKRYDQIDVIPAGPTAAKEAEAARVRMLNEINERRHPRTKATTAQLLERHLTQRALEFNTFDTYEGYVNRATRAT